MFITFHKQISVIKACRQPSALLIPFLMCALNQEFSPGFIFVCSLFLFLFLSTKPCDILCIFKQLIRALLYFYSSTYEHCCC